MSEKTEKKTASFKVNGFLEKNRKAVLGTFIAVIAVLIIFLAVEIVLSTTSKKNLGKVETLYYELTTNASSLDEAAVTQKCTEYLEKLADYTTKGGIAGVRANMIAADLAFMKKDYAAAVDFYDAAIAKGKKSYTAPICSFNKGVCYENLNKTDDAVAAYKYAAEFADFGMAPHAYFSLGRILESKGDYAGAVEAYKTLNDKFAYDDWANLAKTRLITLQAEGKAE